MSALRELRERVAMGEPFGDLPRPYALHTDLCWKAFSGSLDAAKVLHEALLPGWGWVVSPVGACVESPTENIAEAADYTFHRDGRPARSWLLAILDALIQKEEAHADDQ